MHEEWTDPVVCPECEGEYEEGTSCYRCGGSGVIEDAVLERPAGFATCPRCAALMARRGKAGAIWCRRCNGYVKPFEHDAVLRNPRILEG